MVDEDGEQLGIVPPKEALRIAMEKGLDLVEVAPNAKPPGLSYYGLWQIQVRTRAKRGEARKTSDH